MADRTKTAAEYQPTGGNVLRVAALVLGVSVALSACTRSSPFSSSSSNSQASSLRPAPVAPVNETQLKPATPTAPPVGAGQPDGTVETGTETVETPSQKPVQVAAANAQPVTANSLLGNWDVSLGGSKCILFLSLTPRGGGANRGGTLRCPDTTRQNIKGWALKGKQLVLYDNNLNTVASLFKSSASRLDGSTSGGQAISMARPS